MFYGAETPLTPHSRARQSEPEKVGHPKSPIVTHGLWYLRVLEVPQKYHSPEGWESRRFLCCVGQERKGKGIVQVWSTALRHQGLDFFGPEPGEAA